MRDEPLFEELMRYVRFSDEDARRLADVRGVVAPAFTRIAAEQFERIREHEAAHAVLSGEAQIERLKASLVRWLDRVFDGTYDAEHFAGTEQMGNAHVRAGLPQHYVVTAMTLVRSSLDGLIEDAATKIALGRLLDVELAIMLEAHRLDALARIGRASKIEAAAAPIELAHVAPFAIVGLDAHGKVFAFNAAAEKVTGWAHDEVVGRRFVDVVVPPEVHAKAEAALREDTMFEMAMLTRGGRVRRTRWRVAHVDDGHDGDRATFAFGADVTDEVGARNTAEQRARVVSAATVVAGLAHALRNPLNGASLHLALGERALAKIDAPDEAHDALRVAGAELRRVGKLITDFLEFARPKGLVVTETDVAAVVERAMARTAAAVRGRGAAVRADVPSTPLVMDADANALEEVVTHLIENACDAVVPGTGHVVVRVRREPRHVVIEVEDDGAGFPDRDAPVFDAFYSTKADGTGLGLAIVHRVVTDHGGDVTVERREGSTCFRLRLPLRRALI